MIEGLIAGMSLLVGFAAWLWRTHERVQVTAVRLDTVDRDVADIKMEQRTLRDGHVRMDTSLEMMQARLASLDQLPAIATSVRAIETTVTELKQQVIPREALEARFKAIEDRLRDDN